MHKVIVMVRGSKRKALVHVTCSCEPCANEAVYALCILFSLKRSFSDFFHFFARIIVVSYSAFVLMNQTYLL